MAKINIDQQIKAAERELKKRERFYPRWVKKERMTQNKADHEIACMEAILRTLKNTKGKQKQLFNEPKQKKKNNRYEPE